jgi:hypothetical protein
MTGEAQLRKPRRDKCLAQVLVKRHGDEVLHLVDAADLVVLVAVKHKAANNIQLII